MTEERTVGDNIAALLDHNKMTQHELAEKIGVTNVTISRYINNTRTPKAPIIAKIAEVFRVTPGAVLGKEPLFRPPEIHVSMNSVIKVKLTEFGKMIYFHQYDYLNDQYGKELIKPAMPKVDEEGYTRFSLWKFMSLYGQFTDIDKPNVISPIEIIVTE